MKNTYSNEPSRSAALAAALNRPGIEILRYGLVIVLLWIGGMKFTSYEAAGIAPLEMHSPLVNWLYVLMGQRNVSDLLRVIETALGVGCRTVLAIVSIGSFVAPILIGRAGPSTRIKFVDFFTVPIRNVKCHR
jgi:hypothetical protein